MRWWEYPYWWWMKKWLPLRYGRAFNRFLADHPEHPEYDCLECFLDFVKMKRMSYDELAELVARESRE